MSTADLELCLVKLIDTVEELRGQVAALEAHVDKLRLKIEALEDKQNEQYF